MSMKLKTVTLAEISIGGKGYYGIGAPAVEYSEELLTYLRITDICDDGTLDNSNLKSVNDIQAKNYRLQPNDIVFARTGGSTGRNYFYDGKDGEFVYAGFLIKFSLDETKVNPKFMKYYCLSDEYKGWVRSFNTGSTRGNINAQTYANMKIILPMREQQDLVVNTLAALDDKIELNKKINDNLFEQATAIFADMFPNIFIGENCIGNTITPKRGKGLLSKDAVWGDVPVVAGGLEPATYHNVSNTIAPVLTISASGANAGVVNLWHIPVWSSDSSFIDSSMTPDVYFWFVLLKKRQKEIFDAQTGSAQPHIYPQHIAAMSLSDIEQATIGNYTNTITPLFEAIARNKEENIRLISLRDALLPRLMSGELNVPEIDI